MVRVVRVLVMMLAIGLAFGAASAAEIADGAKELAFAFSYADTDQVGSSLDLDGALGWFVAAQRGRRHLLLFRPQLRRLVGQ